MNSPLRQAGRVTLYELADALRSRRALVVLTLYLVAGVFSTYGLIGIIQKTETELVKMLRLDDSGKAGTVLDILWKSEGFREGVAHAAGDRAIVRELLPVPPMALLYGMLAFFYTPILVMMITPARIAEEIAGGSARYAVVRAPRGAWVAGKLCGQALLTGVALLAGTAGAWLVVLARTAVSNPWAVGGWMAVWALRAWVYAWPFLGLAAAIAQISRSPAKATAGALAALFALGLLGWLGEHFYGEGLRQLWGLTELLVPQSQRLGLWRTAPAYLAPAVAQVAALAAAYTAAGFLAFRRRDL